MRIVSILAALVLMAAAGPAMGQSNGDAEFRARVLDLRMAEKHLKESKAGDPDRDAAAIAARQLRDFEKNVTEFETLGGELLPYLSVETPRGAYTRSDLKAIKKKAKDLEKRADRLLEFIAGEADESLEVPDTQTAPETLGALTTTIVARVRPGLVRVLETAGQGVIDFQVQQALTEDLQVVKALSTRLRKR